MAASRNLTSDNGRQRDEEETLKEDSPTSKKPVGLGLGLRLDDKFPLTRWEVAAAVIIVVVFTTGFASVYSTMPASEFGKIKLPRNLSHLRLLKDHLALYAKDYPAQFILGYCSTYIFMQTFMIPGTIFMSLLAGALFGVIRGLVLVVFNATAGASSCNFLSKLIGRPLVNWLWPEKLRFFQAEIVKRREKLLNYMLFLRITPTLPNTFINLASPIVDIPFHVFFLATMVGITPASYITVRMSSAYDFEFCSQKCGLSLCNAHLSTSSTCRQQTRILAPATFLFLCRQAGLALGDLKSVKDLYDFKTLSVLFLIGSISIFPTILKRKRTYE